MKAFTLVNPQWAISEIDLVINTPIDYKEAARCSNKVIINDVSIPLVSIEHLIKMKEATGRAQDAADIRYLRMIKDGRL